MEKRQFNHWTKYSSFSRMALGTAALSQIQHLSHTYSTCTLAHRHTSWHTSAWVGLSESVLFILGEYMKYGAGLCQAARSDRACICGINKRPVPGRVKICFQRTLQPTLLFWLRGPARTHAAIITHSGDNFQYFHLRRGTANKRESRV